MRRYLLFALPLVLLLLAALMRPAGTQTTAGSATNQTTTAPPAAKVFFRVEAENYTAMSGVKKENGDTTVGYFDAKDWMSYADLNFDPQGTWLNLLAAPLANGGKVDFRIDALDGQTIGSYTVANASRSWEDISVPITPVTGKHTLYIVGVSGSGIMNFDSFYLSMAKAPVIVPGTTVKDWGKPIWSDEFNGTELDTNKWVYITWEPGKVNGEKEKYAQRPENVFLDGKGNLVLRGLNDNWQGKYPYTSGRVETQTHFGFKYGRVEANLKAPSGAGSWPAFWLLGNWPQKVSWPSCGEIDIMEQNGWDKSYNSCNTITGGGQSGGGGYGKINFLPGESTAGQFHLYAVDIYPDRMEFSMDGRYFKMQKMKENSPFYNNYLYIILNVALGGDLGRTIDNNQFPMDMVVDYVRVYALPKGTADQETTWVGADGIPHPATDPVPASVPPYPPANPPATGA